MGGYWTNLLIVAGIDAIGAWALGLAIRSGQLSVGHAALAGLGGYAGGYLVVKHGDGMFVALVVAAAVAAFFGFVLAVLTLRLNHLFFALGTLVFAQIAVLVVTNINAVGGPQGLVGLPLVDLRGIVAALVAAILLFEFGLIRGSRLELQMAVLANDSDLVEMSGSSALLLRIAIFTVSGAVVGLMGILQAYQVGVIQPADLGFEPALTLLIYAVVGGVSSGWGPLAGAVGLTLLPRVIGLEGTDATLLLGGLLLATMLVRREGLIGRLRLRVVPSRLYVAAAAADARPRVPGNVGIEDRRDQI